MLQRVQNDALGRMLHNQLYMRIKHFCDTYTPEMPSDAVVQLWLSRLYSNDESLHILVKLNDRYEIITHAVIDIQEAFGHRIVICHQAQNDSNKLDDYLEGSEYIDKLVNETNALCSLFTVVKHIKAIEKRLGYKIARTVMIKPRSDPDVLDSTEY